MTIERLQRKAYEIEPTTSSDVEELNGLFHEIWLETYPNEQAGVSIEWINKYFAMRSLPEAIEGRRKFLDDNKFNPDMISLVAKDQQGKLIGATHGYRNEHGKQFLGMLNVARDYRGKGVAADLIGKVIGWSDPTQPLYLGVATYNQRAQAFYKKNGFRIVPDSESKYVGVIPEIEMVRKGDAE